MFLKQTLVVCLFVAAAFSAPSNKVTPQLAKALQAKTSVNIFVKFQGGNKVAIQRTELLRSGSRSQKIDRLVSELKTLSQTSQRNAFNLLRARSPFSSATQFWATNELYVTGANAQLIQQLATLPEVEEIREERIIPAPEVPEKEGEIVPQAEWNLDIIEATAAWNLPGGNNGQNVVVANIDTGVRYTHEALANNYRASYGWLDPYGYVHYSI
jgi:subtilisin family serine protease